MTAQGRGSYLSRMGCTIMKSIPRSTSMILLVLLTWLSTILVAPLNTAYFCLVLPIRQYLEPLEAKSKRARSYEEWKTIQLRLDGKRQVRSWANKDEDPAYDWQGLRKFKEDLELCRLRDDMSALRNLLRAQATRNCCAMLSPRLYLHSRIQTKQLIHDYVQEVRRCIERLGRRESTTRIESPPVEEEKRRLFSDVRQILGRTTLVLQGGAMLSLCHLGVVKGLYRRHLLPKIITATGTGALVASIVCCTPDHELLSALEGSNINIDAFVRARERRVHTDARSGSYPVLSWVRAVTRRTRRFLHTGHVFDIDVLTQCVRDNIGDVTFEEAYARTGRILNITIARPKVEGTPQLLNYITAPHVVVWSAVAASIATSKRMFAAAPLKCKNDVGIIDRYYAVDSPSPLNTRRAQSKLRLPMERIGELFDVNHYIISQTQPYNIPLVRLRNYLCRDPILGAVINTVYSEIFHRLGTLNRLRLVPSLVQRIVIDELIPSTSSWAKFVITPELSFQDYFNIFNFPSPKAMDEWAAKGERSVWPEICQIRLRCGVEFEVDAANRKDYRTGRHTVQTKSPITNGHSR